MSDDHKSDPTRPGQEAMRRPLPRRFYKDVTSAPLPTDVRSHQLLLDGRAAKTPMKRPLAVPSLAFATAIAGEWAAQRDEIDTARMPFTTLACTTIDAVVDKRREVAAEIVRYADNDLLCYRAETPATLVARQRAAWDPVLAWTQKQFGPQPAVVTGLIHVAQPPALGAAIARAVDPLDPFSLAAMHVLTTLFGSGLLAVAVLHRHVDFTTAWSAAHVDEDFQIELWGSDPEAETRRDGRRQTAAAAAAVLDFMRNP
jgi:chaperone required for assembly of F1-ATPase